MGRYLEDYSSLENLVINEKWALVCEIGFFGSILATVALTLNAFTRRNYINAKYAVILGVIDTICYSLWIYGMTRA